MATAMGASSSSLVLSSSFSRRAECVRLFSPAILIRSTSVTINTSFIRAYSSSPALNATIAGVKADKPSLSRKAPKEAVAPKYTKAARRFYNEKFRQSQRLSKVLAAAGVASRRSSEELIFEGRVKVNGAVCTTPQTRVDPLKDVIYVNGNSLPKKLPPKLYFALNKPKGYICSSGEDESKSVLSLLDNYMRIWIKRNPGVPKPRLFTVGRLDVATSGLIIVTNDGDFAQKVAHPSSGLTKEYVATIKGKISRRHLQAISEGMVVGGVHCTPVSVELISSQPNDLKQRLRIVVCEGRNHEVRHLIENAGLEAWFPSICSTSLIKAGAYWWFQASSRYWHWKASSTRRSSHQKVGR